MDERLFFSSTSRNRKSIEKVLRKVLPSQGTVLEIASGSGEHAVSFQNSFPQITWQASDPDSLHRKSINSWIKVKRLQEKMPTPLDLDVEKMPWPLSKQFLTSLNAIVCINMLHISPWSCTKSLLRGSSLHLNKDAPLFIYGPFREKGKTTSASNENFDKYLKEKNKLWGIRNLEEVTKYAESKGLERISVTEMPANNISVVFKKI